MQPPLSTVNSVFCMQRIALCLGVGTYKDANISNLACASRDAVEVRIFLEHRLRFDEVRWLTDAQVTTESVREALECIGAKLKPGDVFGAGSEFGI